MAEFPRNIKHQVVYFLFKWIQIQIEIECERRPVTHNVGVLKVKKLIPSNVKNMQMYFKSERNKWTCKFLKYKGMNKWSDLHRDWKSNCVLCKIMHFCYKLFLNNKVIITIFKEHIHIPAPAGLMSVIVQPTVDIQNKTTSIRQIKVRYRKFTTSSSTKSRIYYHY